MSLIAISQIVIIEKKIAYNSKDKKQRKLRPLKVYLSGRNSYKVDGNSVRCIT